jgi:hypothetical protein
LDRICGDFEKDIQRRDVKAEPSGQVIKLFIWPRLLSPFYIRAGMVSERYDEIL